MSSTVVTLITLILGLFLGLALGLWISRIKSGANGGNTSTMSQELNDVKVLLKASDDRLKAAEAKSENETKIATQMEEMKATVERMRLQAQEASEKRIASEVQLVGTIDEMRKASTTFFDETKKIAGALASSQTRGKFGEAQLELLLEQAGLREGHEYVAQRSTTDSDSSGIPDITVAMPGGSKLFIDSKFPFDRFLEAFGTEDQAQRDELLLLHTKDLLKHVDALAKRGYHKSQNSPDFVVLFLPFETLLAESLRLDPLLLEKAFKVGVTLATPTSMMALLRTVGHIFTRNKLAENADDITKVAATFLKNVTLLHTKIVAVGKAINQTSKAYEDLIPTAEKTVLAPARRINKLGVAGDKDKLAIEYPESPADVRALNNPDLDSLDLDAPDDFIDVEVVEE
ncbi:DNA recombination protein RmuC [Candidatus Planktophila versatilis]|jgi:DNA recombination protein RmuC|uniref:DNA recombination protein RmuC n=1 Tax=Candidatus Planktophila versatilis TaxID=1884905 RepID=A0ABN5BAF7_9ACTN|nr:DNA recombination protein RmuC [Candidatus Planktophila versatilis]ASY16805.1 DNA recombination protein RmuC [Candidatus Planktophila versatilis]